MLRRLLIAVGGLVVLASAAVGQERTTPIDRKLTTQELGQWIDERFKKEYDMVLIDTPPMLQMPDARVAGRYADAVVMVIRAGQTTRDAAIAARERLTEDGTRVLGTILNDWNPKVSPNGYYGYYHSRTSHYPGDQFQRNLRS